MSRTSFGVAAPASGQKPQAAKRTVPSRMPLEIGKAIKIKKLTPEEEKKLLEIGWTQGQPIPENLTELMEQVRNIQSEAADVDHMPPPTPLDTPPLVYDDTNAPDISQLPPAEQAKYQLAYKDLDVSQLPPAEQAQYKAMMTKIFADAQRQEDEAKRVAAATPAGAGEGVAASIKKALSSKSDIEIEDDTEELSAKKEEKKEVIPGQTHCPRCQFPLDQTDVVVITDADRDLYLQAADSLQLFTKDYSYLDGRVQVTIREQTHEEQEMLYRQMVIDFQQKRATSPDELRQLQMRYATTIQILKIVAKSKRIERPASLVDWQKKIGQLDSSIEVLPEDTLVRKAYLTIAKTEDMPESVFRYMWRTWSEFDLLQSKLEAQAQEADFWKPRTEGSLEQ